ncbi:odorant-binding protein 2a-like [Arvicola amphibius]|uniref:odorant-binding protein 2a-like n=1 Tax=Arvicola amphibius TaxID=1047088 RepID=UPI001C099428|nr:odorant-binding protein 2a-like [Arvicola amphibius]
MKSLLLTSMLLGLVAVLKAQELPTDDQEDYSGTWYPKATIYNGSLPSYKIPSKVFPVKVTAVEGGDLEANIILWMNDQCHDIKILMKKTKEPGKFTSFHGKKSIYITQLPVKDHYIFYCEGHYHGKFFAMGKLMGRNPEENPEAMEEFKKFVQRKGLKEENLLVPELKALLPAETWKKYSDIVGLVSKEHSIGLPGEPCEVLEHHLGHGGHSVGEDVPIPGDQYSLRVQTPWCWLSSMSPLLRVAGTQASAPQLSDPPV